MLVSYINVQIAKRQLRFSKSNKIWTFVAAFVCDIYITRSFDTNYIQYLETTETGLTK